MESSLHLYGHINQFDFMNNLNQKGKLPKVLLLSGNKGIGKFTLINHFINYIFDKNNYNLKEKQILKNSNFNTKYKNNIFPNVIYMSGDSFKNVKVDDVRNLKSTLLKTNLGENKRYIILDDIELFNESSVNALLKTIEEPPKDNYFILINNKSKPIKDTLRSRALELKFFLPEKDRIEIINYLIKENNLSDYFDPSIMNITPGFFIYLNIFFLNNKINLEDKLINNFEKILNLYRKNKDINYIKALIFLSEYYFNKIIKNNSNNIEKIIEKKMFIIDKINKFVIYKLNQASLINIIKDKL